MDEDKKTNKKKERVRGYATFDENNFAFTPDGKGEPVQKNIIISGKSKIYETCGGKKSSLVAHIVTDAGSQDPALEMTETLKELFAKLKRPFPEINHDDVSILDDERLKIRISKKEKTAKVFIELPLSQPKSLQRDMAVQTAKLCAQMYISEDVIQKLLNE